MRSTCPLVGGDPKTIDREPTDTIQTITIGHSVRTRPSAPDITFKILLKPVLLGLDINIPLGPGPGNLGACTCPT